MSVELKKVTPLFASACTKSSVRMYVTGSVSVAKKETKDDCEFGLTPGGWALLSGDFKVPDFSASVSVKKSAKKRAPEAKATESKEKKAKRSPETSDIPEAVGLQSGKFVLGPYEGATAESPELVKTFKFTDKRIPKKGWGNMNVRTSNDKKGLYSGGKDHKGRELVYIYDITWLSETEVQIGAKRRLYPHQIEKLGYAWKTDLSISYTIRIPKEYMDMSESESEAKGGLGSDSDSDSDSSS